MELIQHVGSQQKCKQNKALKELLDQQKSVYEDLLKRQETSFHRFSQMILDSANKSDKQLILARARSNLKNTSVYISEDFSEKVRKRRAELLPAMKEEREDIIISYNPQIVRLRSSECAERRTHISDINCVGSLLDMNWEKHSTEPTEKIKA